MGFWTNVKDSPATKGIVNVATGGVGGIVTDAVGTVTDTIGSLFGGHIPETEKQTNRDFATALGASGNMTKITGTKGPGAYYLDNSTGFVYAAKSYGGFERETAPWALRYIAVVEKRKADAAADAAASQPPLDVARFAAGNPIIIVGIVAGFLLLKKG